MAPLCRAGSAILANEAYGCATKFLDCHAEIRARFEEVLHRFLRLQEGLTQLAGILLAASSRCWRLAARFPI